MSKADPKMRTVIEEDVIGLGCYELEEQYRQLVIDMLVEKALEEEAEAS